MQIIHCDEILLSSLEAKTAISETDRQDVRVDVLTNYERNWAIINAIQRRSNASFVYFEESLRETHQVHAADYLTQGENYQVLEELIHFLNFNCVHDCKA